MKTKQKEELSASRIVILDYQCGKVFVRYIPMSMIEEDGDIINTHFCELLDISESDSYYMVVETDDFIDDDTQ